MKKVRSAGVLVVSRRPGPRFLLLRQGNRYDLPKGHVRRHETDLQAALRELQEETGLTPEQIHIDPRYHFENVYHPRYKRYNNRRVEKTVVVYLGWVERPCAIAVTEHQSSLWIVFKPPHRYGVSTIDGALRQLEGVLQ